MEITPNATFKCHLYLLMMTIFFGSLFFSVMLDARVNCRKYFFSVRVINVWNSLPDEVVSTNQLSQFKTHIKQINLNNFLIGNA